MAGIYIHIPYCKKKCVYCDFYFKINAYDMHEMINCIKKELIRRKKYVKTSGINTIYFGGGTPSILTEKDIKTILNTIYDNYKVCEKPEITLEANPDDLKRKKLTDFFDVGVNRLSIGIQSFKDDDLFFLNRSHTKKDALKSVNIAQELGYKNISVDLMYGLPNQSLKDWEDNLNLLLRLNIQHFSAYILTLEKKTKLFEYVKKNKVKMLDDIEIISSDGAGMLIDKGNVFIDWCYIHHGMSDGFINNKSGLVEVKNTKAIKNKGNGIINYGNMVGYNLSVRGNRHGIAVLSGLAVLTDLNIINNRSKLFFFHICCWALF